MTLKTDYIDGDVLTAADVNAITTAVNSNTDLKVAVGTFNAKGDLLVGLTNDSVGVLSAGTNGYILTASSGATSGLSWTLAGGKILQFASDTVATLQSTTSTSLTDITGLSISFTPISASSYLICELTANGGAVNASGLAEDDIYGSVAVDHDGTQARVEFGRRTENADTDPLRSYAPIIARLVVASGSTSARTIKGQFLSGDGDVTVELTAIAPITLTVLEVAA